MAQPAGRTARRRADACRKGLRRGLVHATRPALAAGAIIATAAVPARADIAGAVSAVALTLGQLDRGALIGFALFTGLIAFATTTAIVHVRFRLAAIRREAQAQSELSRLEAQIEEGRALLLAEPQVVVVWRDPAHPPEIIGNAGALTGGVAPSRLLAFGTWLSPASAYAIEQALDALRKRGTSLALGLIAQDGRHVEADGRPVGSAVVLRLRDVSGLKLDLARLAESHRALDESVSALRRLLADLPAPVWVRDAGGRLSWSNPAYAHAVEAKDAADAAARNLNLLGNDALRAAADARESGRFSARLPVVVAGARRVLDVLEVASGDSVAGIALDATAVESARAEREHIINSHRRTLDQLSTAVAIFDGEQRLVFHNAAYASLFELEPAFLEERPTDLAVLDRLRASRRLPEQADFRAWRAQLHEAYRALEPREHWWHLPGGRTLRVVVAPNAEGGVTYLCDEVTERLALESRYNALIRIQSETLDALAEAVAVFGSDGRLGLHNSAFLRLWRLLPAALAEHPHVDAVVALCRPLDPGAAAWETLRAAVTAIEERAPADFRMERVDGVILDGSTQPLPDGGTLVTFRDVTDSANVERALVERNEALVTADNLKSAFVSKVSYELRSPLTTIIGFAQLLDDTVIGPLNDKQRAYVSHITESSAALLAIINDILDLATIDAGAMVLDLAEVDVRAVMEGSAEGLRDRLAEGGVHLVIEAPDGIGRFRADAKRVRQILYNLLSNAVGFSPPGATVTLAAERRDGAIRFRVHDQGPGIPAEIGARVFDRFESHTTGTRHRGVGLGLSLVRSLTALHGGSVAIGAGPGGGTLVTCTFPLDSGAGRAAAE
ncbi:sensor histidine kinase [Ancylobacter terrae]|uniref:sensor histidine kinase n=1 Tax=Ancylobacter sp. sgz301288 TaxID=3342077 RepID=UPI00385E3CE8